MGKVINIEKEVKNSASLMEFLSLSLKSLRGEEIPYKEINFIFSDYLALKFGSVGGLAKNYLFYVPAVF